MQNILLVVFQRKLSTCYSTASKLKFFMLPLLPFSFYFVYAKKIVSFREQLFQLIANTLGFWLNNYGVSGIHHGV
jgi:hypothetical protein